MSTQARSLHDSSKTFIPAAGRDWLLPLYDPFVKLMGGEAARRTLLEQAAIASGNRILDVGCGTGTLALMIKQKHADTDVVGIDPDPKALARAKRKIEKAGYKIQLDRGLADKLPYADSLFDRVFSSFVFHHLQKEEKERSLSEIRRILKPGGSVHLLDFKVPDQEDRKGWFSRWLHSNHLLEENSKKRLLEYFNNADFEDACILQERPMFLWQIAFYRAVKPQSRSAL